jgi:thiosulfate/3-mercaptopyruvate sulfurtransferase
MLPTLVTTERAQDLTRSGGVTVLDVRPEWTDYLQNHLPGAAWLNIETLRSSDRGLPFQLLPAEAYSTLFSRLGVRQNRPVLIYSAGETRDIDATFVAWLLTAFGQTNVSVLDGGYAKWTFEGKPLDQHYPKANPGGFGHRTSAPDTASLEAVRRAVDTHGALLVDARSAQQFGGGAGAQLRRGHIPGAINHPWTSDLEKRDLALVWKHPAELRASYAGQGITPDRDIIVYCNTGTEASHVYFALRYLLGYPKVRIYTGAWSQWAEREDLPIEQGG